VSNKAKLDEAIALAEAKYADLPRGVLAKIAKVESNYGENLVNPKSSARGPFQFMEQTGPEFDMHTEQDRLDFVKSTDAAARMTLRNKKTLEAKLGRPVTPGELYLAHQQGAGGALQLLANPDTLVYLFDQTLDEVFERLADPLTRRSSAQLAEVSDKNTLVAYYKAGEQALLEALIQAQAKSPTLDPKWRDTDLAKLKLVLRTIARREIVAWEGICRLEKSPRQGAPSSSN
jgi:hypothetical protein